jgi:hypothetical protein
MKLRAREKDLEGGGLILSVVVRVREWGFVTGWGAGCCQAYWHAYTIAVFQAGCIMTVASH